MMLLSDVIKVIGDDELEEFPWGCVVVDTVNLFVTEEFRLKLSSTGHDVDRALNSLGADVKDLVLRANLDTSHCRITAPVGGGMVVEFEETTPEDETRKLCKAMKSPVFVAVAVAVATMTIVAMIMISLLPGNGSIDWSEVSAEAAKIFFPSLLNLP